MNFSSHSILCISSPLNVLQKKLTDVNYFFDENMLGDIFNICITFVMYDMKRKGIIYSKTHFFSLFTPCVGIKFRVTKAEKDILFFFFAKVSDSFETFNIYCAVFICNIHGDMRGNAKILQVQLNFSSFSKD